MSTFFKKALSVFVEFDEKDTKPATNSATASAVPPPIPSSPAAAPAPALQEGDLAKFEKHFQELFDKANLPGPDYYEFWKMMDTLEAHLPDENARIKAVFAALQIQGLNKASLLDSAGKYKAMIEQDKANFESAVRQKSDAEIARRQKEIQAMEAEREEQQQLIARLQAEIAASATKIETLHQELSAEQAKIENAQRGYLAACNAMVVKIEEDIQHFQQAI
jgi:chromosome segregation ATPase